MLDLSNFRNVSVDAAANTMRIGAAVRFGDVYEPLYNAGKEISTFLLFFALTMSL